MKHKFIPAGLLFLVFSAVVLTSCDQQTDKQTQFIKEISDNWQFRQAGDTSWLSAEVPGTVHTDAQSANERDPASSENIL